jgi:hypothetical protein
MLQPRRIVFEGFVSGLIGASAVAVWFLIVDTVSGRPFFTPAMLGAAVFEGLRDPSAVLVAFPSVIMYTMLHVVAFLLVGVIAAMLVAEAEEFPSMLWPLLVLFVVFEFGFYILVATLLTPLLAALAWVNVAIGNLLAAVGMGYFLWRVHPRLRAELADHPLGATGDHEIVVLPTQGPEGK